MKDEADSVISEAQHGFAPPTLDHPETIGPYKIVRVLGEGGMGLVYEAADTGSIRRHVALKVVRGGIDSRDVRTRFEAERQALALMDHSGIAKVLHAGSTESGDPFFAMELVKGLPITEYCDSRRLSTRDRLELFIAVCEAVQHAHQKGVIHRDLKPSNVLITEQDGKPCPKIIDFGIAKALGLQLTEKTLVTQIGQPLGTAAYMSPEQAESSGMDVDTRSDIYSLGVILYYLLVGTLPVDPSELPMHAFIYRLASKDTRAPRPSARFTSLGEYRQGIAQARQTDPMKLERDLDGDLDWVVMKALEPDRARRYGTAIDFAADIRRFLDHQPVLARQPTTAYRLKKFVRRHRTAVAATTLAVLLLITSTVVAAVGLVRATRAERVAAKEAASAQQVSTFLVDLFRASNPSESRASELTARALLDRAAQRPQTTVDPGLQGRWIHTIGTVYGALTEYDLAIAQLEKALEIRRRAMGPDHPDVAETELALGDALRNKGRLREAERHYQRALAIRERAFGRADARVARVFASMAALKYRDGRPNDAEALYKQAIAIDESAPEPDDLAQSRNFAGLGMVYDDQKRYLEAEQFMRRSLAIQEQRYGPNHPNLASSLNNLGALYWRQGRYTEALTLYDRTRSIFDRTLEPSHVFRANIHNNLAEAYWKLGRFREADSLFRSALAIKERRLSPGDAGIAMTLHGMAGSLRDQGKHREAESLYRRALEIRRQKLPPDHRDLAETKKDYAELLRKMGRTAEADALMKPATGS